MKEKNTATLLTQKGLEALSIEDVGRRIADKDGMYGLVRGGKRGISVLFRWRFRYGGKHHDFNCGTWPAKKLSELRDSRRKAEDVLRIGKNPNLEKQLGKQRAAVEQSDQLAALHKKLADARTLESAYQDWTCSPQIKNRKDKGAYLTRAFAKDVLPALGGLDIKAVARQHIIDVLDVVSQRAPVMANRLHAGVHQFMEYCVHRGWRSDNPIAGTKREHVGGSEKSRERVLCHPYDATKHELLELSDALGKSNLKDTTKLAVWIMLGTACRIGELLRARWSNVNFDEREWRIPSDDSKNGKAHVVYLSDFALHHFSRLQEITGFGEWCFPSGSGAHLDTKTVTKQIRDRQRGQSMITKRTKDSESLILSGGTWTPHDLRRTAATLMGHCGVIGDIIERCLNHATGENKIQRVYQLSIPRAEMSTAWEILGTRLQTLLEKNSKVLILRSA